MAHKLKSVFTYKNELVKFSHKEWENHPHQKVNHMFYVENVETEVRGIYTTIFGSTTCPRCRERLAFVQEGYKTKCAKCGLWMASTKNPYPSFFDAAVHFGDLFVWDEGG